MSTTFETKSDLTKNVCEMTGFRFDSGFVQTRREGNNVIVAGTFGKPDEFSALKDAVLGLGNGYAYEGTKGGLVYAKDMTAAQTDLLKSLEAEEESVQKANASGIEAWTSSLSPEEKAEMGLIG